MSAKSKEQDSKAKPEPERDPLVLTVSEHDQLSEQEKQAFRLAHGTVTSDPT